MLVKIIGETEKDHIGASAEVIFFKESGKYYTHYDIHIDCNNENSDYYEFQDKVIELFRNMHKDMTMVCIPYDDAIISCLAVPFCKSYKERI